MLHSGIDLHKRDVVIVTVDGEGHHVHEARLLDQAGELNHEVGAGCADAPPHSAENRQPRMHYDSGALGGHVFLLKRRPINWAAKRCVAISSPPP